MMSVSCYCWFIRGCVEWVHMESVGKKRNKCRCLFLWLVQYGTRGKCPSFCCKDFFVSFLKRTFIHKSFFNWTLQSVSLGAITYDRPGTVDTSITESEGVGFVVRKTVSQCIWQYSYYWPDFTEMVVESTLIITQMTLVTQTPHSDWLDSLLNYCICSPQVDRGSKWVMTNRATPHQYTSPL